MILLGEAIRHHRARLTIVVQDHHRPSITLPWGNRDVLAPESRDRLTVLGWSLSTGEALRE
jgi:hypothetical protein